MSSHTEQSAVTVLGLGPMGRSLAGASLDAGLRTTVWNRTPGRDRELVARGAVSVRSAEEAVAASRVTVVCVVNYDAVDTILRREAVTGALKGRTVVNLTADTPDRARDAAAWAAEHGVRYLDGAIMTPTTTIGTPAAVFLHSGPEDLYREHQPVLEALGGTHTHLGEETAARRHTTSRCSTSSGLRWRAMCTPCRWRGPKASPRGSWHPLPRASAISSRRSSKRPRRRPTAVATPVRATRSPRRLSSMAHIVHTSEALELTRA